MADFQIENVTQYDVLKEYIKVRRQTDQLCKPLAVDDLLIHLPNRTLPTKWHLGHVTWYFESQVLLPYKKGYQVYEPGFDRLFSHHYEQGTTDGCTVTCGMFSRPTVESIQIYRAYVDEVMEEFLDDVPEHLWEVVRYKVTEGLRHEQQHQELMLEHIKQNFAVNPLMPAYNDQPLLVHERQVARLEWLERSAFSESTNVSPVTRGVMPDHYLANRLITNGEYLGFVEDGGYTRAEVWSANGRMALEHHGWQAPNYWRQVDNEWLEFTLNGLKPLDRNAPVIHVSFYEAEAYANWAGCRLPSDMELAARLHELPVKGNFVEQANFHPIPGQGQWYGDAWEWTQSDPAGVPVDSESSHSGVATPGILRGGACVTSRSQMHPNRQRLSSPASRQGFSGIRLACSA